MNDDLHNLLHDWQPHVPEPSGFRREVWRRIAAADMARQSSVVHWIETIFLAMARPKVAIAFAAVAILAGTTLGSGLAGPDQATAYLHSVNPYAQISR